ARVVDHGPAGRVEAGVDDDGEPGAAFEAAQHPRHQGFLPLVDGLDAGCAVDVDDGGDPVAPRGRHVVHEEHVRAGQRAAGEQVGGPVGEHHGGDRPELLAALDVVEPFEVLGAAGVGEQGAVSEGARAVLAAALEPGDDAVAGEFLGDGLGDVVGPVVGDGGAVEPVAQGVVAPAASEVGAGHGPRGDPLLRAHVQGAAEGGAGVPGGGLHPQVPVGPAGGQAGVGDAVQGDTAGQGQGVAAGLAVQPVREVQEDLLQDGLGAGGEVGVVLVPGLVRGARRGESGPVDAVGAEAAVAGGVDVFAQAGQVAGGVAGGERHDHVLLAAAQEGDVLGEFLIEQVEGVGQGLGGEGGQFAVAVAAGQVGGGLPAAVEDEDRAVGVGGGGSGGRGVGAVVRDEDHPGRVQAGQGLGEELGGAAGVLQAERVPGVVQALGGGGAGPGGLGGGADGVQVRGG